MAQKIFDEMKSGDCPKPDLITYSTMIKGYCHQKNIERALMILDEMEKVGIKPDEVVYNSLLDGCCKADDIQIGLMVYQNMLRLGIKPSNVTYSILIRIYGKAH